MAPTFFLVTLIRFTSVPEAVLFGSDLIMSRDKEQTVSLIV